MAINKCKHGHFFDDSKFSVCPVCQSNREMDDDNLTVQSGAFDFNIEHEIKTEFFDENTKDNQNTIPLFMLENEFNPVTGWLISIENENKGKSFELHDGRNFIGRSLSMDVVLTADNTISRKNHFSIIYDNKSNEFFALPGEGSVFVNEMLLCNPTTIEENDILSLGSYKFIFVPYCKEGRTWNEK